jgi:Glucose-6-phosphate dehydrogenase, NAD binding domain
MATITEHDQVAYGTDRDDWQEKTDKCKSGTCLTVIVFGATGDLAAKKTFKSLCTLYTRGCVPSVARASRYP